MRVLIFSSILYLVGVATVLFFRPGLMFHLDGRWKEFGTGSEEKTIFPFWLFCVAWAVVSYIAVMLVASEGPELAAGSLAAATAFANVSPQNVLMPLEEEEFVPPPPSATNNSKNRRSNLSNSQRYTPAPAPVIKEKVVEVMKPGYYKLDSIKNGVPRYIYLAEEPGAEESSED